MSSAKPLPDVQYQVLDETQWLQQRAAMLACIAAEDQRRAEAEQEPQQVETAGCTAAIQENGQKSRSAAVQIFKALAVAQLATLLINGVFSCCTGFRSH